MHTRRVRPVSGNLDHRHEAWSVETPQPRTAWVSIDLHVVRQALSVPLACLTSWARPTSDLLHAIDVAVSLESKPHALAGLVTTLLCKRTQRDGVALPIS